MNHPAMSSMYALTSKSSHQQSRAADDLEQVWANEMAHKFPHSVQSSVYSSANFIPFGMSWEPNDTPCYPTSAADPGMIDFDYHSFDAPPVTAGSAQLEIFDTARYAQELEDLGVQPERDAYYNPLPNTPMFHVYAPDAFAPRELVGSYGIPLSSSPRSSTVASPFRPSTPASSSDIQGHSPVRCPSSDGQDAVTGRSRYATSNAPSPVMRDGGSSDQRRCRRRWCHAWGATASRTALASGRPPVIQASLAIFGAIEEFAWRCIRSTRHAPAKSPALS